MSADRYRPVWAKIDVRAVTHNTRLMCSHLTEGTGLMAVVKADAYGHGADIVVPAVIEAGADRLCVASVEEGIILRDNGITVPILLLSEIAPHATAAVLEYGLTPTVCSERVIAALEQEAKSFGGAVKVHVKIDTGMNRLGVRHADAVDFIKKAKARQGIDIEGVFTHFATADEDDDAFLLTQLDRFIAVVEELRAIGIRPVLHAANSAAALRFPQTHFDFVRTGIALYGLEPFRAARDKFKLEPVMSLMSAIGAIKDIEVGEGVSYGLTFKALRPTTVALVPIGYADGVSRALSNHGRVCVQGKSVPIVGRVCMDQMLIDITGIAGVCVGDEVVLIGTQGEERITMEEIADTVGTINYEIACSVSSRVPRIKG